MKNKKGFEFSFAWLFAIIVGGVILFLAIFATTRLVQTEETVQETTLGREIGILLSPVETNLESAKIAKISTPSETRILNGCDEGGDFGRQEISIGTKSRAGGEWEYPGGASSFYNKYLFSADGVQGEDFVVMAKPFKFPFKVADLSFLWSFEERYCFVGPPNDIKEEIGSLKQNANFDIRLDLKERVEECGKDSKIVCFDLPSANSACDVVVSTKGESVRKEGKTIYYSESIEDDRDDDRYALLYGAIFSETDNYECQVKRLMKRTSELSEIYLAKTEYLSQRGCSSNLEFELRSLGAGAVEVDESLDLRSLGISLEGIRRKNNGLACRLF